MPTTVEELRINYVSQLAERAAADAAALNQLVSAMEKTGATTTATDEIVKRASQGMAALNQKIDGAAAATAKLNAENSRHEARIATLFAKYQKGGMDLDEVAEKLAKLQIIHRQATEAALAFGDKVESKFKNVSASATVLAHAIGEAARAAQLASQYQDSINRATGISLPSSEQYASRGADIAAYGQELDRLRAKYNPLFAVSKQYEATLNEISRAQKLGAINTHEAEAATSRASFAFQQATVTHQNFAGSTKAASYALRDLGIQSVDVFQGLLTGQPIMTTLLQQGGQITQVAYASGVSLKALAKDAISAVGSGLAMLLTPLGLTIGAMVALGGAAALVISHVFDMANENRVLDVTIRSVGRSAELSSSQLQRYTTALSYMGVSRSDAAGIVASLARNTGLDASAIGRAALMAPDAATALGVDTAAAAKEVGLVAAGSYEAIKKLDDALNFLTADQRTQIRVMLEHGDKIGGVGLAMGALGKQVDGLRWDKLSALEKILDGVGNAYKRTIAAMAGGTPPGQHPAGREAEQENAGLVEQNRQLKAVEDVTKKYTDQNRVLDASIPLRIEMIARIEMESSTEGKLLDELRKEEIIRKSVATTIRVQTDALEQETLAVRRSITSTAIATGLIENRATPIQQARSAAEEAAKNQQITKYTKVLYPDAVSAAGEAAVQARLAADAQTRVDYDQSLSDQAKLIAAGPTGAAAAGAKIRSDTTNRQLSQIDTPEGKDRSAATLATAMAGVGAERGREIQAMERQGVAAQALVVASDSGRAAMMRAAAASEANEAAATREGVAIDAVTRAILSRKAAEEQSKSVEFVTGLKEQTAATLRVASASDYAGIHVAEMASKTADATKGLRAGFENASSAIQKAGIAKQIDSVTEAIARADKADGASVVRKLTIAGEADAAAQLRVSAAYDGTELSITKATNAERARKELIQTDLIPGTQAYADAVANVAATYNATSAASKQFAQEQASVSALSGAFIQSFETIGSAISQAFIQGQGAAVNWGNVMRSVISQVIQQVVRLAVINPIINSIFGQNTGTLGTAAAVLSRSGDGGASGGGSGGGGFGATDAISALGTLSSASGALGGPTLGSILGLTGAGGSIFGAGGIAYGGMSAATAAAASAPLAAGVQGAVATGAVAGEGATALGAALNGAQSALGGTVLGAGLAYWAAGIGAGFGVGSLAGGLVQGALGKTGPAPVIGAGVGAIAGTVIGTLILPGFGTVIGGLIGGALGGAGGGLIGPKRASAYTSTGVDLADGNLRVGQTYSQIYDAGQERKDTEQNVGTINGLLNRIGAKIISIGALTQIGQNTPGGYEDPSKFGSLSEAFGQFRFSSSSPDQILNRQISDKSFASFDEFQAVVVEVQNFLDITVPGLKAIGESTAPKTVGSLVLATKALTDQFDPAIVLAQKLGYAEADLTDARAKSIKFLNDQANEIFTNIDNSLVSRFLSARASNTGSPYDQLIADTYTFENAADQQRKDLKAQMVAIWGDAVVTWEGYAAQMGALEKTLGEERLTITKSYTDKMAAEAAQAASAASAAQAARVAAAGSLVTSISDYVTKLQFGSQTVLSPLDQYAAAQRQFQAVAGAASAGDYNSQTKLTGYADQLLGSSRAVYGSGAAYAADYSRVRDALEQITNMSPETLTASAQAAITQTQTAVLADSLEKVRAEIAALRAETQHAASAPARAAA